MPVTFDYVQENQTAHVDIAVPRITMGNGSVTLTQNGVPTQVNYSIGYDRVTKMLVMNDPSGQLSLNYSATDGYSIAATIPYPISERGQAVSLDTSTPTGRMPAIMTLTGVDKQGAPLIQELILGPVSGQISNPAFKAGSTVTLDVPDLGIHETMTVRPTGLLVYSLPSDFSQQGTHINLVVDGVPCFLRGTLIETENGPVPVEALAAGMMVVTRDNGLQPVRWIGSARLDAETLALVPVLRPICIRKGALAVNSPSTDLFVSPQHRVLVRSKIAQRMFGAEEVLVAAKQLLQLDGIDVADDLTEVEYFHILFDRHEIILSNGAETESLYTGAEALKSVGPAARKEIFAIFPDLIAPEYHAPAAREILSGRNARKLAVRHRQHDRPMVC